MTVMAQTLQLAFRIAFVWTAGFLIAAAVSALMPAQLGFTLYGKQATLFVPFSRMGFWTCILAAVIVTALVVVRAMAADLGLNTLR
jgi:hypothetical protein